jgi:hydroxymethylbilane synthase
MGSYQAHRTCRWKSRASSAGYGFRAGDAFRFGCEGGHAEEVSTGAYELNTAEANKPGTNRRSHNDRPLAFRRRMPSASPVRLGTRASQLARWQAEWVAARLRELGVEVELVPIATRGDRQQQGPIRAFGGQGVFTKEIQRALLEKQIDLAVHSLKDLPTAQPGALCLAAVPERAPVSDVLVCRQGAAGHGVSLDDLGAAAVLGTGSLRRRSQLLHVRPDLQCIDVRGNVETRLRKLDEGDCDALVLAEAGLRRLAMAERITQVLPASIMLPAVGQGALGLETRSDDQATRAVSGELDHWPTRAAVLAERAMLAALEGGCLAPIAAWGRVEHRVLTLSGRVLSPDGRQKIETTLSGDPRWPDRLGRRVAEGLIAQGAADLIQAAREMP